MPEEDDEANESALKETNCEDGEPVKEGLVNAEDTEEAFTYDTESVREAEEAD